MIALWMVYATAVAALVGSGAALLELASGGYLRQRRWLWMLALALAVAIPVWTIVAPGATATASSTPAQPTAQALPTSGVAGELGGRLAALIDSVEPSSLGRFDSALSVAWAIAAALAIAGYGVASWSLAKRRRSWRPGTVNGHAVLLTPAIGPAVVGALRPQIVLPEWTLDLSAEQRALMLEHEHQHVLARDPLLLHAAALLALLMPWNVAAWWLNRRLRLAVELDCDARVLSGGRDARAYGTLLLEVCSRRVRPGALLAPALLERTSSLAKRILAMQPNRGRHPRARIALGATAAVAVMVLACEMPTPEMVAPDGKDAAAKRVYGAVQPIDGIDRIGGDQPSELVAKYFPAIARGEGEPAILFVVKSATGSVVLTEAQPAAFARMPGPRARIRPDSSIAAAQVGDAGERQSRMRSRAAGTSTETEVAARTAAPSARWLKTRSNGAGVELPVGVGALRPEDIATIDVSKHAAGTVAPKPVSVIVIVLKKGAAVPPAIAARQ